jgi:hypothetical protein
VAPVVARPRGCKAKLAHFSLHGYCIWIGSDRPSPFGPHQQRVVQRISAAYANVTCLKSLYQVL